MSDNYKPVLRRYTEALGASDYATIKSLFAEDGTVTSPFLFGRSRMFISRFIVARSSPSVPKRSNLSRYAASAIPGPFL